MSVQSTQRFCPCCQRNVMATRPRANHTLHFLITMFTCGFWLFIWPLLSIRFGGWRCGVCGTVV
jgi:hypothetical protein